MGNKFSQSFALLPCGSDPWIRVAEPPESQVEKFIGRRSAFSAPLPVERPAKNELRRTIMLSGHPPEPMVDQRGLPDSGPGSDGNDIDVLAFPRTVQESDILLTTKQIASSHG